VAVFATVYPRARWMRDIMNSASNNSSSKLIRLFREAVALHDRADGDFGRRAKLGENDPSVTMHLLRSFVLVATKRNHGVYLCRSAGGNEAGE
jgi:hypothetical protein